MSDTTSKTKRAAAVTAVALAGTIIFGTMSAAAPLDKFTADELDDNWAADRMFPTGGVDSVTAFGRPDVAQFSIDAEEFDANEHKRTEGLQQVGNFGDSVEVDLYLDPDWADKAVRAGLWVVGDNGADARDNYFGIIEFTNIEACDPEDCISADPRDFNFDTDHVGFRIWDSNETWIEYLDTPFEWDTWVTLSITLDTDAQEYVYAIDGVEVGTAAAGEHFIREVFLNGFNFGADELPTLDSADYQIHFHNEVPEPLFPDVDTSHPFFWEVQWLADQEITTGYENNEFRPTAPVTRQAMAAFLYRLSGEPEFDAPEEATFMDVATDHPFFKEIEWLAEEGISTGYDAEDGVEFRPTNDVSRQAMAAFIYRVAGDSEFTAGESETFTDVASDHAFFKEIEWLADAGISEGYEDDTFRPSSSVSRQAMAAFLFRVELPEDEPAAV